ncbi:MAG: nitrite reductase small subunit [Phenylobacterium sp.]|jgi:nitrite reductase (NADH) small subunit|nr:nitrite reductase small subunit [Phenylobacterium sp.]
MNALVKEPAITWIDVGAVTDIPRRGARRLPSPRGDIAIFRTGDGAVFALMDACPHKGGPLSQGIVHGQSVTCPLHGRVIDLATGEGVGADKGSRCAPVVPLEVRDGRLWLGLVGG